MSWVVIWPDCVLELGVDHGVAALDPDIHVVDDGVHVGDGVAVGLQLLSVRA